MWESGLAESLRGILHDLFTDVDERAGAVPEWLRKVRDGLIEAKDRTFELTAAGPGSALWSEMKENARLASKHPAHEGGMFVGATLLALGYQIFMGWVATNPDAPRAHPEGEAS